jgi:membrane associated rhomboid family serine protease
MPSNYKLQKIVWKFVVAFCLGVFLSALVVMAVIYAWALFTSEPDLYGKSVSAWAFLPALVVGVVYAIVRARAEFDRQRRHIRTRAGHCENCDYDLRGLPEPRCPECGYWFKTKRAEKI